MAIELTELQRTPAERRWVHVYDVGSGSLDAGDRIQVRVSYGGGNPETIMDETVPAGKAWTNVAFQFQAQEDDV